MKEGLDDFFVENNGSYVGIDIYALNILMKHLSNVKCVFFFYVSTITKKYIC